MDNQDREFPTPPTGVPAEPPQPEIPSPQPEEAASQLPKELPPLPQSQPAAEQPGFVPQGNPQPHQAPPDDRKIPDPEANAGYRYGPQPGSFDPQGRPDGRQGNPYRGYGPAGRPYPPRPKKDNGMAVASLILGILSLVTGCCGLGGVIFGALGIIFSLLSRAGEPMETPAKVGLGLSIGGLVLGILILGVTLLFSIGSLGSYGYYSDSFFYPYY